MTGAAESTLQKPVKDTPRLERHESWLPRKTPYCAKMQLKKIKSSLSGAESRKTLLFSVDFGRESNRSHAPPEKNATCQLTGTPSLDVLHVRE